VVKADGLAHTKQSIVWAKPSNQPTKDHSTMPNNPQTPANNQSFLTEDEINEYSKQCSGLLPASQLRMIIKLGHTLGPGTAVLLESIAEEMSTVQQFMTALVQSNPAAMTKLANMQQMFGKLTSKSTTN
jgi:hypothetical protein